ncbi:hypothetical protein PCE1_001031 [Barthelona sp. PCE]
MENGARTQMTKEIKEILKLMFFFSGAVYLVYSRRVLFIINDSSHIGYDYINFSFISVLVLGLSSYFTGQIISRGGRHRMLLTSIVLMCMLFATHFFLSIFLSGSTRAIVHIVTGFVSDVLSAGPWVLAYTMLSLYSNQKDAVEAQNMAYYQGLLAISSALCSFFTLTIITALIGGLIMIFSSLNIAKKYVKQQTESNIKYGLDPSNEQAVENLNEMTGQFKKEMKKLRRLLFVAICLIRASKRMVNISVVEHLHQNYSDTFYAVSYLISVTGSFILQWILVERVVNKHGLFKISMAGCIVMAVTCFFVFNNNTFVYFIASFGNKLGYALCHATITTLIGRTADGGAAKARAYGKMLLWTYTFGGLSMFITDSLSRNMHNVAVSIIATVIVSIAIFLIKMMKGFNLHLYLDVQDDQPIEVDFSTAPYIPGGSGSATTSVPTMGRMNIDSNTSYIPARPVSNSDDLIYTPSV